MRKMKLLPISAIMVAAGIGVSGNAHATAYAVAYQNVTNGQLLFQNVGGPITITGGSTVSTTNSSLNGTSSPLDDSDTVARGAGPADATFSCIGACAGRVENAMTSQVVAGVGGNYAFADAQVKSEQLLVGDIFQAANIAEFNIDSGTSADATGTNASGTGFLFDFTVGVTTDLTFEFDNDPYLKAFTDALGLTATAAISATFQLDNISTGESISWSPNGLGTGAVNGMAGSGTTLFIIDDDYNLNQQLSLNAPMLGPVTRDPTVDASLGVFDPAVANLMQFGIDINGLVAGDYSLSLTMKEQAFGTNNVPEPTSLAMLGLGIAGMGFVGRRRKVKV